MFSKSTLSVVTAALILTSSFATSAEDREYEEVIAQLTELIAKQQYPQAYNLSTSNMQFLGESKFDYFHGLASLHLQYTDHAVFAFERLIAQHPDWYLARYYLMQSYLQVDNLPSAKSQADFLLNHLKTPSVIKSSTRKILQLIEKKELANNRHFYQQFSIGSGYDNNVNAGTREDRIIIPNLGEFLLLPESKDIGDEYAQLGYKLSYNHPFDQKSSLLFGLNSSYVKLKDFDQYDRLSAQLSTNYVTSYQQFSWRIGGYFTPLMLDNDLYRTQASIRLGSDYQLTDSFHGFADLRYGEVDNKIEKKLDHSFIEGVVGVNYLTQYWYQSLGVDYKDESADLDAGEYNAREIIGVSYQANVQMAPNWQLLTAYTYQWIDFQTIHPLFLIPREDELLMLAATLKYKIDNNMTMSLALNYQDKTSNLPLFEYDRIDSNLSISYGF